LDSKTDQEEGRAVLKHLFTSRVRVKLLTLFLSHPEEAYYIRQTSRLIGETYSSVYHELRNLAAVGLLHSEPRGGAIFYQANTEHCLFDDLRGIVQATKPKE